VKRKLCHCHKKEKEGIEWKEGKEKKKEDGKCVDNNLGYSLFVCFCSFQLYCSNKLI